MFQKTYIKLTAIYLLILMTISIFFSAAIYQVSTRELERGFNKQAGIINRITDPIEVWLQTRSDVFTERQSLINEAKNRVLGRLILTNLVILLGGGFLSYYLARKTLQPIEEAHEAQSRFTADASHELRTPIAAMQTEIEVLLSDPKLTLKDAKGQLNSNLEELAKLTSISDGLLRLARLDADSLPKKRVLISEILKPAIDRYSSIAEKKDVIIKLSVPDKLTVIGDKPSLIDALATLVDNAIKYSPKKSTINVKAHRSKNHVFIEVKDNGAGIKVEDLPHIFDRFYRADVSRNKNESQGYGLGLAIAKNIIELHGGIISASSTLGKGTTIKISLLQ